MMLNGAILNYALSQLSKAVVSALDSRGLPQSCPLCKRRCAEEHLIPPLRENKGQLKGK